MPKKTNEDKLDAFIDDVTHLVKDHWQTKASRLMSANEMYRLNGVLAEFFNDFRYDWFFEEDEDE